MQIIADLQIHSKYAQAVSKFSDLKNNAAWAVRKGIKLLGTGDWQHPKYFEEIKSQLVEHRSGIFRLKPELVENDPKIGEVDFLLQTEISSIYKQGGKGRRIHNLIFSPSIETCEKVIKELQMRGANLLADGRPIVGISSKDLLEMLLSIDENILFIPAHVWTPWFGLFGSKSGFDSIEECFGDLSKYIYAIETGLSSDPRMNWQVKELENRSILSFSDAHSGQKMGREATVFAFKSTLVMPQHFDKLSVRDDNTYDYFDIIGAIKQNKNSKLEISHTIEFFPEEGKYHWSGHRAHNYRLDPVESKKIGEICPVCGKKLTIGVENRVLDLSNTIIKEESLKTRENAVGLKYLYDKEEKRKPFVSVIPLQEILYEVSKSKAAAVRDYESITAKVPEFEILLEKTYEELEDLCGLKLAEAVKKVRARDIFIDPGYDGVFGKVKVFK